MDELSEPTCSPSTGSDSMPPDEGRASRAHQLGTGLICLACVIAGLVVFDRNGALPFRMPHAWYPLRDMWMLISLVAAGVGVMLRRQEPRLNGWAPAVSGRRFQQLILYTRQDCHLCDVAQEVLEIHRQYLPEIVEVDIDKDAVLIAKFTLCVPVVEIDGKVRFRGRVDQTLLRRMIEGTDPTT